MAQDKHRAQREAQCPSCTNTGTFALIGIQSWSPEVAARASLPPEIALYQCEHCHSTISHIELDDTFRVP